jgi:hypothetical protein
MSTLIDEAFAIFATSFLILLGIKSEGKIDGSAFSRRAVDGHGTVQKLRSFSHAEKPPMPEGRGIAENLVRIEPRTVINNE